MPDYTISGLFIPIVIIFMFAMAIVKNKDKIKEKAKELKVNMESILYAEKMSGDSYAISEMCEKECNEDDELEECTLQCKYNKNELKDEDINKSISNSKKIFDINSFDNIVNL